MNNSISHQSKANETICPSCNRFVGAHDSCPYCGTGIKKRISLRFLRYTSLVIAIVGLVCLQLMAMHRDIPVKSIASITPAMNFGYITVMGKASQPMRYYKSGGKITSLNLYLEDESGDIRVAAYRNVAEELNKEGISVRKGDKVKVSGTVKVRDNNVSILLQNPKHFKVISSTGVELVSLEEVPGFDDDTSLSFKAKISRINLPGSPRGPFTIKVEDGTGSGILKVWPSQFEELDKPGELVEGAIVKVRALKSSYRGKPQLQLESPGDLVVLAQASATDAEPEPEPKKEVKLQDISSQNVGEKISVKAKALEIRKPPQESRAPYLVTLESGGTKISMVFWDRVYKSMKSAHELKAGAVIEALVTVGEYRGKLQLRLNSAEDLKILETTKEPEASSAPVKRTLSPAEAIGLAEGTRAEVRGVVAYVRKPGAGSKAPYRIMMEGKDGLIQLTCWPDVYSQIPESKRPGKGAIIKANVTVKLYKGNKQLKLSRAADFVLESKGTTVSRTPGARTGVIQLPDLKSIKNVSDYKPVRVDGKVNNIIVSDHPKVPFRIILEDESGALTVAVWPDVWEKLSDAKRPKTGDSITVFGTASTFKGSKQVRVKFANDIKIR